MLKDGRLARPRLFLRLLAAVIALALAPSLAAQIPPDASWRTFSTEHFRVTYVAGLEPVARRAAARAESAFGLLASEFPSAPRGKVELVVADNVDFVNGYASLFPTNRIVIYAHPALSDRSVAFYDEWIGLVVLHELAHLFHLDDSGGVWERLRTLLGRNPLLFPQLLSPGWLTEGLATYYESRLTSAGRVRGTYHSMVLRTAILEDEFFSIDRATGTPVTWPGGGARYIYGAHFLDYLAHTRPGSVPRFVRRYGKQVVPFALDAAARAAFDVSFDSAWSEWRDSLWTRYTALADTLRAAGLTEPEVLTTAGRFAAFPRYAPRGGALSYAASTGRDEPAILLLRPDGIQERIADRTTLGPAPWYPAGDRLLFAQLQYVDPYRVYSDLYRVTLQGDEERVSRAARIWEPDLHPDGRRAVVVTNAEGTNRLAIHDLRTGATQAITRGGLDEQWSLPRWSPRGDLIAAGRWSVGGLYDVVLVDTTGAVVREVTRDRAVDNAPAWSHDGRYLLFSSDRTGIPNLFAWDRETDRLFQVTNVLTGAFEPDVSPDGRWIAFSYYRADGYHIARIPFDPAGWGPAPPVRAGVAAMLPLPAGADSAGGPARPYSAISSLLPASWSPVFEAAATGLGTLLGAELSGVDVVERHAWSAGAGLYTDGARFRGGIVYSYRGLGLPIIDAAVRQSWEVRRAADATPTPAILGREREAELSVRWMRQRWRSVAWIQPGIEATQLDFVWSDAETQPERALQRLPLALGATLEAGLSMAQEFDYSLGPQQGGSVIGAVEGHRYLSTPEGASGASGYLRFTSSGRTFASRDLAGFAPHVLALRASVGVESGSSSPGFGLGGILGGDAGIPAELDAFGSSLGFALRGYPEGVQRGDRVITASAEYRFPLLLVERGVRVLPIFLERISGDLFVDAGTAWCTASCDRFLGDAPLAPAPLLSTGAEVIVDLQAGFLAHVPLRLGIAVPLRAVDALQTQVRALDTKFYVGVGRSF